MLKIATLQPENPFFLAPMEAVNCASFRILCRRRGAAMVFTDMIDADTFSAYLETHTKKETIQKYINPQEEEKPLAIQLGGSNLSDLTNTYDTIKQHADLIDFNAGCPLGYMLGKKGGAYLMKHPDQLYKLLKPLRQHITHPFSIKIRSGWDKQQINAPEIAKQCEHIGLDMINIHPRTRLQRYREKADWPLARKIKDSITIPLCLSGDVTNAYTATRAFQHTRCDFIMLGRGAKANPSIFTELNDQLKKKEEPPKPTTTYTKSNNQAIKDFTEFLDLYRTIEHRNNLSELKDHALWTATGAKNNKKITQNLLSSENEKQLLDTIDKITF